MRPFALSVASHVLGVHPHKGHRRRRDQHQDNENDTGQHQQQDDEIIGPSSSQAHGAADTSEADTRFPSSTSTSRLPSETINPLSHTPNTLHQLAVAGLSPEDELPSLTHRRFPHEPLGTRKSGRRPVKKEASPPLLFESDGGATSGAETDATITSQQAKREGSKQRTGLVGGGSAVEDVTARMRHLGTMTAILHRCLRDGDIVRAKRAFGLLLRTRDVDVRLDNMWTIGSEILMRDGEERVVTGPRGENGLVLFNGAEKSASLSRGGRTKGKGGGSEVVPLDESDSDSDSFIEDTEEEEELEELDGEGVQREAAEGAEEGGEHTSSDRKPPRRWGNAASMAQVKLYFETLAQHHPHDPHRPRLISAVDFWPALFGIELYNLDAEFQASLYHVYEDMGFPPPPSSSSPSSPSSSRSASPVGDEDDYKDDRMDLDDDYNITRGGDEMRGDDDDEGRKQATHLRHAAIDALRAATQRGALEITSRMDALLENAPYTTHAELLRLRAHAALFIGDLYLPSRLIERYRRKHHHSPARDEAGGAGSGGGSRKGEITTLKEAEHHLKAHLKTPEEHVALARRGEEQQRARAFFRRVVGAAKGGRLEDWILRSLDEDDEDE